MHAIESLVEDIESPLPRPQHISLGARIGLNVGLRLGRKSAAISRGRIDRRAADYGFRQRLAVRRFGIGNQYRLISGILILTLFESAYISEIFRSGIEGVGKTQIESARAIGFTRTQTYRYVIIPQAFRQVLPPLVGQLVSLIKDSSLLSVIAITEFTQSAQQASSINYDNLETYFALAVGYLVLTVPISLWSRWLEQRFKYET